jgi:hypothetical protein
MRHMSLPSTVWLRPLRTAAGCDLCKRAVKTALFSQVPNGSPGYSRNSILLHEREDFHG